MDSPDGVLGSQAGTLNKSTGVSSLGVVVTLVVAPVVTLFVWFTVSWLVSPLRKYPGPFLAGYTNLWRLWAVRTRKYHHVIEALHKKYGPIVRIGPNTLDLDYPELIKTIYSTDGKWRKTEFYESNSVKMNGKIQYHIFSTTSQTEHARMKRPIVKYYSMSYVLALEPHIDTVITDFCKHLDWRFINGPNCPKPCDLGEWIDFYAWDVISSVTFSHRFGYMDQGYDYDGSLAKSLKALDYFQLVGQIPWLDFVFDKNPIKPIGPPNLENVARIAVETMVKRMQGKDEHYNPEKATDYLQHFIDSKSTHPDLVDDGCVVSYLLVNLIAGADTTSLTILAIFYYCLKNPSVYARLQAEIADADLDRDAPVPYNTARQLPYLEATVREAIRVHPAVAMLLERYVPEGGITLPDGSYVPAGAAVGLNPWVLNRNKGVWGEDVDAFRPERWLQQEGETDEQYKERMRKWNAYDLGFGNGSRICLGRNLAIAEIYKITATLMNRYEFELVDPSAEWTVWGSWFTKQSGVKTHIKLRK